MPTLADIYSTIDSYKRRLNDVAGNSIGSFQQMLGNANDQARNLNQLTAESAQEGLSYGPKTQQLGSQMAEAYNPLGMTTWHGSPHVFERFDLSKSGTGVGGQSYGSGLYVAQNPKIAEDYAKNIMGAKSTPENIAVKVLNSTGSEDVAKERLKMIYPQMDDFQIQKSIETAKNYKGNLYKVDLPDTHIRRMLDWDAPIKDQPAVVRNLAKKLGIDKNDLGGDLLAHVGKDETGRKTLQDAGIRGVKYLDEQTGSKKTGTRNFVVFDPNHLTILERTQTSMK